MNHLEQIIARHTGDPPAEWQWRRELMAGFSWVKSLYDFQLKALEVALKGLWLYYRDGAESAGQSLAALYRDNGAGRIIDDFGINRMGFWMATGSGKTLVIVKLIEMLAMLMERGNMPRRDIMFLVYRDNLLDQFKSQVDEYNASHPDWIINLIDLKKYEETKRTGARRFSMKAVNVFYYRADLFFERRTAKKITPRSVDNNGNWYVLLDEAHRGDSKDSILQKIYSGFSRNGFLFNFSATFIDEIDQATCAYNFNLQKFIGDGYGKKIYVSGENIEGFDGKGDFSDIEKQKIVLKTLILQTYIKACMENVRAIDGSLYHNPLLMTIVNRVTDKGSDLRMFFAELEKIAGGKVKPGLFESAKRELGEEFKGATYLFDNDEVQLDGDKLSALRYEDILRAVFNSETEGKIEVIRVPRNKQELVFKMQTSDTPFALIKIGNVSKWVKEILQDYLMIEHYHDASIFKQLNEDASNINILMGSRAFYEGWDSNRPNIILFVNIGVGRDSKKFVLQAAGRGVRIEPVKNQRKRMQNIVSGVSSGSGVDRVLYDKVKPEARALESLFIYGTNAENLRSVISSLKSEGRGRVFDLGQEFIVNPDAKRRLLLVPVYKHTDQLFSEVQAKYPISSQDLDSTRNFLAHMSDRVLLAKYDDFEAAALAKARSELPTMSSYQESRSIGKPELLVDRLLDYFGVKSRELDKFGPLGDEHIVHFRKIKFSGSAADYETLKARTNLIVKYPASKQEDELAALFNAGDRAGYDKQSKLFDKSKAFTVDGSAVQIKHLANHYYHPLLVSDADKAEYLSHIIRVPSEVRFIQALEDKADAFAGFDWWMFSKLDETLDKVYIPYYDYGKNRFAQFNPDFIFWLQKGQDYKILFVDPKGAEQAHYQHKADGYTRLFGQVSSEKSFPQPEHDSINVKVHLRFFGGDKSQVAQAYRNYWADAIEDLAHL